jgi:V/A-type H+-transporting ATPase subunit E
VVETLGDPEALAAEVTRRAHHRAVEIAEDARRRAAAILEEARQECESLRRQTAQAVEHQVAALERKNAGRAELEALRRFLLLREGPVNGAWLGAEAKLRELVQQPGYREALKRCALRAARELGASELTLSADPVGHQLLSANTLEHWSREAGIQFRRAAEPAATWGGLLASSGRMKFDATFPVQLALAKEVLRNKVFQILSKGDS